MNDREIRVFISSTFNDMQAERDHLVRNVFPILRQKASRRGVVLTEVDLRWGITEKEAQQGRTIGICLDEIDASRPFFIGLLGSRYGWTPGSEAFHEGDSRYPWLRKNLSDGLSITEIEMLYGALRKRNDDVFASFYIRDDGQPDDDPRQTEFKQRILAQNRFPADKYTTLDHLGSMIESRFDQILDELYPEMETNAILAERNAQFAIAHSSGRTYMPDERSTDAVESFLAQTKPGSRLFVTGASGSGKSALLAHITDTLLTRGTYNLSVSLGSSGTSLIAGDITARINSEIETYAVADKKTLIIIDAIDSIEANKPGDVSWLDMLPSDAILIVSAADGTPQADALSRLDIPRLNVYPLLLSQRRRLVERYFANYSKHLEPQQIEMLVKPLGLMDNTLLFVTMLEEVRCFGSFDGLPEFMDTISSLATADDFYGFILGRKERFYTAGDKPSPARTILSLVAASRNGLEETELMMAGNLNMMELSRFLLGNAYLLRRQGGIVRFAHNLVAQAVVRRYFADTGIERTYHRRLLKFFQSDKDTHRATIELPYQYWKLGMKPELYAFIGRYDYLNASLAGGDTFFMNYWATLISDNPTVYSPECYLDTDKDDRPTNSIFDPNKLLLEIDMHMRCDKIAGFLPLLTKYAGYTSAQVALCTHVVQWHFSHEMGEPDFIASWLNSLAVYQAHTGLWAKAFANFAKALEMSPDDNNSDYIYSNLGEALLSAGENFKSDYFYREALEIQSHVLQQRIGRYGEWHTEVAVAMSNLATTYWQLKEFDKAEEMERRSTEIYTKLNGEDDLDVAMNYNNRATMLLDNEEFAQSLMLFERSEAIYTKLLGADSNSARSVADGKIAALLGLGRNKEAIDIFKSYRDFAHTNKSPDDYYDLFMRMALLSISKLKAADFALIVCDDLLTLDLTPEKRAHIVNIKAQALSNLGRIDEADEAYSTCIDMYIEAGDVSTAVDATLAQAKAHALAERFDKAIELFRSGLSIMESYNLPVSGQTAIPYQNLAVTLFNAGRCDEAIEAMEKACSIRREHFGDDDSMLVDEYLPLLDQLKKYAAMQQDQDDDTSEEEDDSIALNTPPDLVTMSRYADTDSDVYRLFVKGNNGFKAGNMSIAIHNYTSALRYSGELNDGARAWITRSIAYAYEMQSDNDDADKHYAEALMIAQNYADWPLAEAIAHDYAEFCWNTEAFDRASTIYIHQLEAALKAHGISTEALRCLGNMGSAQFKYDGNMELALHAGSVMLMIAHGEEEFNEYYKWGCSCVGKALGELNIAQDDYNISFAGSVLKLTEMILDMNLANAANAVLGLYGCATPDDRNPTNEFKSKLIQCQIGYNLGAVTLMELVSDMLKVCSDEKNGIEIDKDTDNAICKIIGRAKMWIFDFDEACDTFNKVRQFDYDSLCDYYYSLFMTNRTDEYRDNFSDIDGSDRFKYLRELYNSVKSKDFDISVIEPGEDISTLANYALVLLRHGKHSMAIDAYHRLAAMQGDSIDQELTRLYVMALFMDLDGYPEEAAITRGRALELIDTNSDINGVELFKPAFKS